MPTAPSSTCSCDTLDRPCVAAMSNSLASEAAKRRGEGRKEQHVTQQRGDEKPAMVARRSPNGVTVCPLFTLETWYNLPAAEAARTEVMGLAGLAFLSTWCCGTTLTSQSCQFNA